jgi:hypothetical protein
MNRRNFLKNSGKVILVTSAIMITGNLVSSCSSDDNFSNGYYDDGYYDDGYYDDGYYDDGYYDDGYYDDGYYGG